MSDVKIGAI